MRGSIRRYAAVLTAVLTLWGTGAAYLHLPAVGGNHGGAALTGAADMEGCAGCGPADAANTAYAPCQAPCVPLAVAAAAGVERAAAKPGAHTPIAEDDMAGQNPAPNSTPPRPTLTG